MTADTICSRFVNGWRAVGCMTPASSQPSVCLPGCSVVWIASGKASTVTGR